MSQNIERDVRFLKRYAVVTSTLLVVLSVAAFSRSTQKAKFEEIDVERINVVEPNGMYRMVISNRPRSIGPIYKGKPFGYAGGGRPGIIFFNDEGTENGGLTFTGQRGPDGRFRASTHMSFDQYNSDQVVNLDYNDNNGQRLMGFSINDRADVDIKQLVDERDSIAKMADTVARKAALDRWAAPRNGVPLVAQRLFVGRDPSKSAIVNLLDPSGKSRLRMLVDSLGEGRIEFLDQNGKVVQVIGGKAR
jgi:hypothetical protein